MQIGTSAEPPIDINSAKGSIVSDNLATRTRVNQQKLLAELKPHYDFVSTRLYASRGSSPITGWHGERARIRSVRRPVAPRPFRYRR